MDHRRTGRISFTFFAIAVGVAFLLTKTGSGKYELSTYTGTPLWWWIVVLLLFAYGSFETMTFASSGNWNQKTMGIVLLGSVMVLLTPVLRGYFLLGPADPVTHYLSMRTVLATGHIPLGELYPASLIVSTTMAFISYIALHYLNLLVPIVFWIAYVLGNFLIARMLFGNGVGGCTLIISSLFLYNYYEISFYPQAMGIFFLPIAIYFYLRLRWQNGGMVTAACVAISTMLMIILDPVSGFIYSFSIFVLEVIFIKNDKGRNWSRKRLGFFAVSFVGGTAWFLTTAYFAGIVNRVFSWFIVKKTMVAALMPRQSDLVVLDRLSLWEKALIFLKYYGVDLFFIFLALLTVVLAAKSKKDLRALRLIQSIFLVSLIAYTVVFSVIGSTQVGRFFACNPGMWSVPVLSAFLLHEARGIGWRFMKTIQWLVLVAAFVFSGLTVYHSAYLNQVNWQVTAREVAADNWLTRYGRKQIPRGGVGVLIAPGTLHPPDHFGYDKKGLLAGLVGGASKDAYMLFAEKRLLAFRRLRGRGIITLRPLFSSAFTAHDFRRLENDRSVDVVYSAGDIKSVLVGHSKGPGPKPPV